MEVKKIFKILIYLLIIGCLFHIEFKLNKIQLAIEQHDRDMTDIKAYFEHKQKVILIQSEIEKKISKP